MWNKNFPPGFNIPVGKCCCDSPFVYLRHKPLCNRTTFPRFNRLCLSSPAAPVGVKSAHQPTKKRPTNKKKTTQQKKRPSNKKKTTQPSHQLKMMLIPTRMLLLAVKIEIALTLTIIQLNWTFLLQLCLLLNCVTVGAFLKLSLFSANHWVVRCCCWGMRTCVLCLVVSVDSLHSWR